MTDTPETQSTQKDVTVDQATDQKEAQKPKGWTLVDYGTNFAMGFFAVCLL
jgi:hypothetical protein